MLQDPYEAVRYFQIGATQGHAGSQCSLGQCYEKGQGVKLNLAEAASWYRKAAEQGNVFGQLALGTCYAYGRGVPENKGEAILWLGRAFEKGDKEQRQEVLTVIWEKRW